MTTSQGSFHNYPQRYPRSHRKAADVVGQLQQLVRKGPRTLVGTVVDSSFHTTQGYVVVTTQMGVVNVFGVPYGSVVNGMRIFCRQIGGQSTVRSFVYDGMAPNLSATGYSGSFGYTSTVNSLASGLAMTNSTGVPTSSSITGPFGYYWFFFFYLPQIPASTVTLWQLTASSGGNVFTCEYLVSGKVQIRSQDGHGYITNAPVSAHNVHWVLVQPGVTGQELLIDTVADYTGITSPADDPAFSGAGIAYQLSLLSNNDGTGLCPLGSWLSKWGFGTNWNGSYAVALQSLGTGLGTVPSADSELPTAFPQMDVTPLYSLLCTDAQGSSTLADSAGAGGTVATISTGGAILQQGPY